MKRMSEPRNGNSTVSPVERVRRVTVPLIYASPTKPLKSEIVAGSASIGSKPAAGGAGAHTWNAPPSAGVPPGIGTGAACPAVFAMDNRGDIGDVTRPSSGRPHAASKLPNPAAAATVPAAE